MRNSETILIVTGKNRPAYNSTTGARGEIKETLIGRNKAPHTLFQRVRDLSATVDLAIYVGDEKIILPVLIQNQLISYLRFKRNSQEKFDCVSFAHYLNNISHSYGHFDRDLWIIPESSQNDDFHTGDTVAIAKDRQAIKISHFAIYLDDGIFISKFGRGGDVLCATLTQMIAVYQSPHIFKLKPKIS